MKWSFLIGYRRIASTMFNDGVIKMGRVLVLFAFTSQMGQQYPTDAWTFWDIYHAVLKGTEYAYVIFIDNDVSDWSISFVTSYLIGQLFMKWSFLIGSFSSILIGG
jgi:hypothetical protein